MVGKLQLIDNVWYVQYDRKLGPNASQIIKVLLHPEDVDICNSYGDNSIDWINKEVRFELINEKKDDETLVTYAKTIPIYLDEKLEMMLNDYSNNLMYNNSKKWDEIFNECKNLNKRELIEYLKINYTYPIKIVN